MTQTPRPVRSASGVHSHWTRDDALTVCGRPVSEAPIAEERVEQILRGEAEPSCRHCQRHSAAIFRALAR